MKPHAAIARTTRAAAAIVVVCSIVACGGSPTEQGAAGDSKSDAPDPFAAVMTQLEGLQGQARTQRLVELARKEKKLSVYTSNTDLTDQAKKFTATYGLEVGVYRAKAHQVLQRLLQESKAGFTGADVYDSNAEELTTANTEGLLRPYEGPVVDGLVAAAKQDGWVGSRLNAFTVSWNTNLVKNPPKSLEDLADKRFSGILLIEPRAFEWFMSLSGYFVSKRGMTQAAVDQMFTKIVANAIVVEGNTTHAQFLGAGEYGVSISVYSHLVDELIATGAPLARKPVVEPLVIRPNGLALLRSAQNPATALLFMEWVLTDGQQLLTKDFRIPARAALQKGQFDGVDTVPVDILRLVSEGKKWEDRYEALLRHAKGADK